MACGGCFPCLPNGFTVDSPPVRSRLAEIYEPNVADARYGGLILKFQEEFGKRPTYFVRAPGRVNLIGEHVDYSGYSVLPCAISQDVVMACSVEPDERLVLTNVDDAYPTKQIELTEDIVIDSKAHHWTNYFLCGYKGILEHVKEGPKPAVFGMRVAVDGTVPAGSGLSSSSAMVCASALAALHGAKKQLDKSKIATIAAKSEQYMGVMSGGMDQAISMTARAGFAKHIHFDPLTTEDVKLPAGCSIVVANTLVEANKYATADTCYNRRVVECILAAKLLASKLGLDWRSVRRLRDVEEKSEKGVAALAEAVDAHLQRAPYSIEEVAQALGVPASELQASCVAGQPNARFEFPAGKVLHLHARAYHVYTEAGRVAAFDATCRRSPFPDQLAELGRLMDGSHASCRDYFDCSCPELDQLTAICREAGALGSRLTGAGWGGCTVSLVPDAKLASFLSDVTGKYFRGARRYNGEISKVLFACKPGNGAAVYIP